MHLARSLAFQELQNKYFFKQFPEKKGIVYFREGSIIVSMKDLIFFYGDECPNCIEIEKDIDLLIKEGFDILKLEIWNNMENDALFEKLDDGEEVCGGVPFLINQKSGKRICGEATLDELRSWARGE